MRQTLDKIFTYTHCGTVYTRLVSPKDLLNHAVASYVLGETVTPSKTGQTARDVAERATIAIDEVHSGMKDLTALTSITSILFHGGNAEYIWRDRIFVNTRDAFYRGLGLSTTTDTADTVLRSSRVFVSKTKPTLRRVLADVVLSFLCEIEVVRWETDLAVPRIYEAIAIPAHEIPLVVAESRIRNADMKSAPKQPGSRIMFGKVFEYLREGMADYAGKLNTISATTHYAGRIADIAARSLRGTDPALPKAPFAVLASAVNFVDTGPVSASMTPTEMLTMSTLVGDVMNAITTAPHVKTRTVQEFAAMFDVRRVLAIRTRAAVVTVVTRRYGSDRLPARVIDTLPMPSVDVTSVTPAAVVPNVPALDHTVDQLRGLLSDPLVSEAVGLFAEGDPNRLLVSPVAEAELKMLAACLAAEVEYTSKSDDPQSDIRVSYVFRPDETLTGWEDLTSVSVDGVAVTPEFDNVLRLCKPYEGSGKYIVGDGLAEALSTGKPLAILGDVKRAWTAGGKVYEVAASYPRYEYDPQVGSRVTGIVDAGTIQMTPFMLMGMAPLKSHSITLPQATRNALADASRLFVFAYQAAAGDLRPIDGLYIKPAPGMATGALFREDAVGTPKRNAVLSQLLILYRDAFTRFLTSAPARMAYSQIILRASARAQTPTTLDEARAYLLTTQSYMLRFAAPFAGMPAGFADVFKAVSSDTFFEQMALYGILHNMNGVK